MLLALCELIPSGVYLKYKTIIPRVPIVPPELITDILPLFGCLFDTLSSTSVIKAENMKWGFFVIMEFLTFATPYFF